MLNNMRTLLDSSSLNGANQTFVEGMFELYQQDPNKVADDWRKLFAQMHENGKYESNFKIKKSFENFNHEKNAVHHVHEAEVSYEMHVQNFINAYRYFGHLVADINPLKVNKNSVQPKELELSYYALEHVPLEHIFKIKDFINGSDFTLDNIIQVLRKAYTQKLAAEFLHIVNEDERRFIQDKIEQEYVNLKYNSSEQKNILQILNSAEGLEKYLAARYPGAKRFGLEGCDSLLVAIDAILCAGSESGLKEIVLGMNHRGRLNALVNLLGKMPDELFNEFEGKHAPELESGDVKYHQGFSSDIQTNSGRLHLSLIFNPSHLEIVTPVVIGSVRARQQKRADNINEVLGINVHGDAAFAGQGVVMEILNMSQCPGFKVGGSIHIITNNQIGFTTDKPEDARSTLYCTDIGKMLMIPIFHVNADCPESVYFVAKLALEYRSKFNKDVIIDIIGYRRLGHNEADEPSATQPLMYNFIKQHPTALTLYQRQLIEKKIITEKEAEKLKEDYRQLLDKREQSASKYLLKYDSDQSVDWKIYAKNDWRLPFNSELPLEVLEQLANLRDNIPNDFKLHPRVQKIVDDRKMMGANQIPLDWGFAETLAYATLLNDGYNVRLSGQDCARGTFFHRHVVWHDQKNGAEYISLQKLHAKQGNFEIVNSILSEEAVLGFEYGFATTEPKTLTIWEAQFGDFANGAQVVIDQFISSGEQKWGRLSGLVMLLPHGYEGQGPEHSSARLERYLQLCAQDNIQVCVPSTPAQIYHLLRRQILRQMRKPLIVITPKSLLRHKKAVSTINELHTGSFYAVIDDHDVNKDAVTRLIMCSGKVYYELLEEREKDHNPTIAIIRIEQLYPFPDQELASLIKEYKNLTTVVWCQEEPENQGAWYSSKHNFEHALGLNQKLIYAGRGPSAAPAVGYSSVHHQQQQQLLVDAIGKTS